MRTAVAVLACLWGAVSGEPLCRPLGLSTSRLCCARKKSVYVFCSLVVLLSLPVAVVPPLFLLLRRRGRCPLLLRLLSSSCSSSITL